MKKKIKILFVSLVVLLMSSSIQAQAQSIVIIAHLDDEVIWMLPFLEQFDKVYVAAVPMTYGHCNIATELSKHFSGTWCPTRGIMEVGPYCDNFLNREIGPCAESGELVPGDYIFESGTYVLASNGFIYVDGEKAATVELSTGKCYGLGGDFIGTMSGNPSGEIQFTHIPGGGPVETGRFHKERTNEIILKKLLRDIIADPEVDTIYTHNPWGEYGHEHHRMVSNVVRQLATRYGKDVWIPNIVVVRDAGGYLTYTGADLSGMADKWGYYQSSLYKQLRNVFLEETERARTLPWYPDYSIGFWTWGDANDRPQGNQQYVLAVSGGVDYTLDNLVIQELIKSVPVI